MSRNNIRGPTSALTEFLREQGISARTILERSQGRREQDAQNTGDNTTAGPSQGAEPAPAVNANGTNEDDMDVDDAPTPRRASRAAKGKRKAKKNGNDSDDLDASEEEATPAAKKRKLSKAAEAKLKAKAKANARKKGVKVSDSEGDVDDEYTAPSKGPVVSAPPPIGNFEMCASCEKQFTVTRYTLAARPGPGWLCHECAKAAGLDPFKKPAAPRKRKAPEDKRKVVNFEARDAVQSLSKLCIQVISKHIEDIEAFGDIGHINMDSIAKVLAKNRSLTPQNAPLFYDVQNTMLTFYDATKLESPALCSLASLNPNLQSLRIDMCGRINDSALQHWTSHLSNLTRLELLGPFLVYPEAWIDFFKTRGPQLQGFLITQSPRFDLACVEALATHCAASLSELRLQEIGKMSDEFLPHIAKCGKLTSLDLSYPEKSLSVDGVVDFLTVVGAQLAHLSLSGNEELDDTVLSLGIQPHAHRLHSLSLATLPLLTDKGIADFFSSWGSHPPLENLDISRSHAPASAALEAVLKHSGPGLKELNINSWKDTDTDVLGTIAQHTPQLQKINVGWCRGVDDFVVKSLLENCEALQEIKVYGCNRLTENCPKTRTVNIFGVEAHVAG